MRICWSDKDGQGGETPDLAEVVKALTAERDALKKDLDAKSAELAKHGSQLAAARKTVADIYHERETLQARHPNALASMPGLELGEDFRPTKASMEAREKWWKENDWARKEAERVVEQKAADQEPTKTKDTPAVKPDVSGEDLAFWRNLRRTNPQEFKRRSKDYDAFCESEDRKRGIV